MTVWVGFTQTGGRLRARRPLRRRDEVHAARACCASRSTRSRRSRTCRCRSRPCSASSSRRSRSSAIPVAIGFRIAGEFVPGITTVLLVVLLLGGIQLITVGIIGEYLGRVYDEVKRRPLYVVRERLQHGAGSEPRRRGAGARTAMSWDEGRGHRRRRHRPRRRPPADASRARAATSTSAGPGSAARWRRSTSATAQPARALLPPPVHQRRPHRRALRRARHGGRDRVAAFERRHLHRRPQHPFTSPLDLLRFTPLSLRSRIRMGIAVLRLQRRDARSSRSRRSTAREWISSDDGHRGLGRRLGPAAARQVRRPRRRDLDGLAVEQADRAQARSSGERGSPGAARLPARRLGAAARALARSDRLGRRAGADRPPGAARSAAATASFTLVAGRPGLVPPRPRPARASSPPATPPRLRRGGRDGPERHLHRAARRRARGGDRRRLPGAGSSRSSTRRRSACCSSSTARSAASTGPTSPTPSCRSSG